MRTTTTAAHLTPSQQHQISSAEYATCKDKSKSVLYRTGNDFHELLPLLYVCFLMATSTDRSIPDYHPAPFHNGSIPRDPVPLRQVRTHATPPVGRLGAVALLTSFHNGSISHDPVPLRIADGITILPIVPVKRRSRATLATTAVICGIQCRCGIWRKEKGLPDAAVARTLRKMQILCTALGFCAIWTTSTYTGAPRLCKSNKFICTALGFCVIWTTSTYTGAPRLC